MKIFYKYIFTSLLVLFLQEGKTQSIALWKLADLEAVMKNAARPTIINFWATFCKPCIEEIPYFQELVKKYESSGVKLILVSLDVKESYPKRISTFASRLKFTAPIKFLDESDADLFCSKVDEAWSGAIPASIFINNKTGYRKFFEDQLSREDLNKEIQLLIRE